MKTTDFAADQTALQQALNNPEFNNAEKADLLVEWAIGLQTRPKTPEHLRQAVTCYQQALVLCPPDEALARARIQARMATAWQMLPEEGATALQQAQELLESALPVFRQLGTPEETAEAELNYGLVLQTLSNLQLARLTDAIAAYQRALRTFTVQQYPTEFAILHNNLATAFLSMPMSDERASMREALAVQSFEEALKVVTLIDQPTEYAMLQNNLGNALQSVKTGHPLENQLRALEAYAEALKVRTPQDTPLEYANTIANRANVLINLPSEARPPEWREEPQLLQEFETALEIFQQHGEPHKAELLQGLLAERFAHRL